MSEAPRLFDTHCHLTWEDDGHPARDQILRARASGVDQMVCVATDLESARAGRALALGHPGMRASVGIHPNDVGSDPAALDALLDEVEELATTERWSAVGETGVDFYRDWSTPEMQRHAFRRHLAIARRARLPIIIHCRHAADAALEELRNHGGPVVGVMHCYSEGPEPLEGFLELGLHVSFAGNLTYKKSDDIREAARRVPLERLLVETDAPFLAPQAVRGKRNEPSFLVHTLAHLAELLGVEAAVLADVTRRNGEALFGPALASP